MREHASLRQHVVLVAMLAGFLGVFVFSLVHGAGGREGGKGEGFTDADFSGHLKALEEKMPKGFHAMIQKPFVVVSDEPADVMRMHAERTVKWAVDKLKADYFTKDPADILDIWLFKDKVSYDKYTKEIFQDEPTTPYGYYSAADKALIMNIATGGGTLVHELVLVDPTRTAIEEVA